MTLGEKAKDYYVNQGLNCAVSVLLGASDTYNLGLSKADAKMVTAFGGGMGCGLLCGARTGMRFPGIMKRAEVIGLPG